jgi:hypothetical protein
MVNKRTIVLVLEEGGDFGLRDVELIVRHINGKWKSRVLPRIICLWDKSTDVYDLGTHELHPLKNYGGHGTWSRIQLYSPEMEQFKPFLYVDLDTAIIQTLENIIDIIPNEKDYITLEDFSQKGRLATGLVWFPKDCVKTQNVWKAWQGPKGFRMDYFIRGVCQADKFWQQLTDTIVDFKPKGGLLVTVVPLNANIVCFHGQPRIFKVAEGSMTIDWVQSYVNEKFTKVSGRDVTVIIPYKDDRGWLQNAIDSVPDTVQLIVSQGLGNWPQNFNKVLDQVEGKYIKYLHEDDMLTPNSIDDSVRAIEEQGVDFIHGDALEVTEGKDKVVRYVPKIKNPELIDLLKNNVIHSVTLMYKKEVFEKLGGFNESPKMYSFEEFEFNLRCLMNGFKIGYVPLSLGVYRRHFKQIIRTVDNKIRKQNRKELINFYL